MDEKKIVKQRGQPKKEEIEKQNIAITIHVNKKGLQYIENKAIDAGYSPKDRAKWLKNLALSHDTKDEEIENLSKALKEKENMLKTVTQKLIDQM